MHSMGVMVMLNPWGDPSENKGLFPGARRKRQPAGMGPGVLDVAFWCFAA